VHQLREKDVESGRPMQDVLPELLRFGSRPLVGYWIDFDVRMLDKYLIETLNIHLPNRRVDVSTKLYYDRKYGNAPAGVRIDLSLASIQRDLHLPMLPQHDAFNDALSAAQMYVILKDMIARGVRIRRHQHRSDDIVFAVG
jgi:DNA polymerase III subunit epsilon